MIEKPLNIAHRGGADLWPENTLEAFAHAIELGVDGIEFDMQLSQDGVIVIHHDATLKPAATRQNGSYISTPTPRIDALNVAALQLYDIGRLDPTSDEAQRRHTQTPIDGARIATLSQLDDMVARAAPPDFRLYAELKTEMRPERAPSDALADAYSRALETSPVAANHIAISFDWRCINRVRQAANMAHAYTTLPFAHTDPDHESARQDKPDSQTAALRRASQNGAPWWDGFDWRDMDGTSHGEKVLRAIHAANGTHWFAYWRDITADTMRLAESLNLQVSAWTVNEEADMRTLAQLGVTALISDRPDIVKQLNAAQSP